MIRGKQKLVILYFTAAVLTVVTIFYRESLPIPVGECPLLILLMFPILISALIGGLGPGLVSTSIIAAYAAWSIICKKVAVPVASYDTVQWYVLVFNGILVSALSEFSHRAQRHEFLRWTQLTRTQLELQETKERFEAIFDQMAVGLALVAPDGRVLRANQKLCEIVGYQHNELLARTFQDITHPDDLDASLSSVRRMLAGDIRTFSLEKRYIHKSGSIVWCNLTVALMRKPDRTPDYSISVVEDIGARKTAEAQRRISEERLQFALAATTDGLWDWDLRSGLVYFSPRYYEIVEVRPEDMVSDLEFFKKIVYSDDLPHVMAVIEALIHGIITTGGFDYRLVSRSGAIKWIRGTGRVVERNSEGAPVRMVGTISDISMRKSGEEALIRRTEELAKRNAELERFNRAMVGRELAMITLKQQVNVLSRQLGQSSPFPLAFLNTSTGQHK